MAHCIPTYMLASGLMTSGHELVAGAHHDPARQHDRARPDPAQLAPGHEVRHPLPRLRPRRLRHPRLEPARAHARAGGLRLVRHPGLDRRRGAAHASSRASSPAGRRCSGAGFGGHTTTEWLSFLLFWGLNIFIIYRGMDLLRAGRELGRALRAGDDGGAAVVGHRPRQRPRARCSRQPGQLHTLRRVPARLRPVAHGDDRLLGHALPEHARLHALRPQPARADVGPGGGPAHHHVRVRGHGRDDHQRHRDHLRRGDLGPDQARRASSRSPVVVAISMFTAVVATLAVNIAANVVSPANDFANAFPRAHRLQDRRPHHRPPRHR